jgi:pantothenate kinase
MSSVPPFPELVARARRLTVGSRRILGVAGAPGAGKSTIAAAVVRALGSAAALLPMDGFHLAGAELVRLGRRDRMGAPDTFDTAGYLALLRRLREAGPEPVYAPTFDRQIEEPVAGAILVEPTVPLVVTEGNYLLLDRGGWQQVRPLLDEAWFVAVNDDVRVDRLIQRHIRHGKTFAEARDWVLRSDEANARLIAATRERADLVITESGNLLPG